MRSLPKNKIYLSLFAKMISGLNQTLLTAIRKSNALDIKTGFEAWFFYQYKEMIVPLGYSQISALCDVILR